MTGRKSDSKDVNHRSSKTGRYVKKSTADRSPDTHETEKRKKRA